MKVIALEGGKIRDFAKVFAHYEQVATRTLYQVYKSYSEEKERAYNYYLSLCAGLGGYGFKIVSFNTFMFSIAFIVKDSEGVEWFHYITSFHYSKIAFVRE